jgi:lipopolysaccharide transport system permease protein
MKINNWELNQNENKIVDKLYEVWNSKELLFVFVKRDLLAFYKQTILGPIWFFIQPILSTLVFMFAFGKIAGIQTNEIPKPIFYFSGIILWNYFSDCFIKTSTVFKDNLNLYSKVYFPRLILPINIILSNLTKFTIQLLLLLSISIYYKYQNLIPGFSYEILLFPFLMLLIATLSLGLGLIITSITTRYRDFALLVNFSVQLLLFSTTAAFPLPIADSLYKKILLYNPMTNYIEAFRILIIGRGFFNINYFMISVLITLIIIYIGLKLFIKVEKNFIDTI